MKKEKVFISGRFTAKLFKESSPSEVLLEQGKAEPRLLFYERCLSYCDEREYEMNTRPEVVEEFPVEIKGWKRHVVVVAYEGKRVHRLHYTHPTYPYVYMVREVRLYADTYAVTLRADEQVRLHYPPSNRMSLEEAVATVVDNLRINSVRFFIGT